MTAASSQGTLAIDTITLRSDGDPALQLRGSGAVPEALELAGSRLSLAASCSAVDGGWQATIPLLASRWGGPLLPPSSGTYRLCAPPTIIDGTLARSTHLAVNDHVTLPEPQLVPGLFRIAFVASSGGLSVVFSAPLTDDEHGPAQQARLEAQYRSATPAPLDAVFFESFYGQNASCNPLALDRALATARPDIARYWSVADASVAVPEGAIPIVEGSTEWWRVRAAARLLVVNDWLRNRYRKRRHQKVLQTWHGTMLKKLALTRARPGLRTVLATLRELG